MLRGYPYKIALGGEGMNLGIDSDKVPANSLEESNNITLHQGGIQKDFGDAAINTSSLGASILAGVDYYPDPASQRQVIYTNDGKIQKSTGVGSGSFSVLASGLSTTAIPHFLICGNELTASTSKVLFLNGDDFPQVLSGDGSSTERIGFVNSLTNGLDTASGSDVLTVNLTAHGLTSGETVSLVGFTSPIDGQIVNVSNAIVTVLNPNAFTVTVAGNFTGTTLSTGGTGKIYAHPADWTESAQPSGSCLHLDRVYVFKGHNIYISDDDDHTNFERGNDVYDAIVRSDMGAEIRCMLSTYGRLIVFKHPYGIVSMGDPLGTNPDLRISTRRSGIAGKNCAVQAGPYVYYIASDATVHRLTPVDTAEVLKDEDVTGFFFLNDELRSIVDVSNIEQSYIVYDNVHQTIIAIMPSESGDDHPVLVRIDVNDPFKPKVTLGGDKGTYGSLWIQRDDEKKERVVAGDKSGFLVNITDEARQAFSGSVSFPWTFPVIFGDSYIGSFRTVSTDFGDQFAQFADRNKQLFSIEVVIEPTLGDFDIQFNIYVDGAYADSIRFFRNSNTPEFPLSFPITFGEDMRENLRQELQGVYGKRFAFEGINATAGQNFKISKLIARFQPGDERVFS